MLTCDTHKVAEAEALRCQQDGLPGIVRGVLNMRQEVACKVVAVAGDEVVWKLLEPVLGYL